MSSLADLDDGALIERYVAGDNRAFDAIVDRYEGRVYAVAMRMTSNPDDASDVMQETFISAMRALKRFRGDAKLSTWLHRVTVNAALDHQRKRSRRPAQPLDEGTHEVPSEDPGPDERAESAVRAAAVQQGLAQLSPDHRAVLVLHDLQGMDYAEVADALDVPVGTVKSRIHRARLELAKLLGHLRSVEPSGGPRPLTDEP